MNENTTLTDLIDAALAAGCQISVPSHPKTSTNRRRKNERERKHRLEALNTELFRSINVLKETR